MILSEGGFHNRWRYPRRQWWGKPDIFMAKRWGEDRNMLASERDRRFCAPQTRRVGGEDTYDR